MKIKRFNEHIITHLSKDYDRISLSLEDVMCDRNFSNSGLPKIIYKLKYKYELGNKDLNGILDILPQLRNYLTTVITKLNIVHIVDSYDVCINETGNPTFFFTGNLCAIEKISKFYGIGELNESVKNRYPKKISKEEYLRKQELYGLSDFSDNEKSKLSDILVNKGFHKTMGDDYFIIQLSNYFLTAKKLGDEWFTIYLEGYIKKDYINICFLCDGFEELESFIDKSVVDKKFEETIIESNLYGGFAQQVEEKERKPRQVYLKEIIKKKEIHNFEKFTLGENKLLIDCIKEMHKKYKLIHIFNPSRDANNCYNLEIRINTNSNNQINIYVDKLKDEWFTIDVNYMYGMKYWICDGIEEVIYFLSNFQDK